LEILHPGADRDGLIQIVDITGRVLLSEKIPIDDQSFQTQLRVAHLPAGLYLLDTGEGEAIPFSHLP
jgi:hypothetical protein